MTIKRAWRKPPVFVRYYSDAFGVVRQPVVDFVGFGRDMETAWKMAKRMP
jgi:hypothetical protein